MHPFTPMTPMERLAHPDPGPSSTHTHPTSLDNSEFFQVLTAPYHPPPDTLSVHRAEQSPDHVARCRGTINWSSTPLTESAPEPSASSRPPTLSPLDQPIYQPHGHWAWAHGLSINDPKQLLSLRKGAQCSASIDTGTISGKEIKYICRKWKMSKRKEWYGFYSELALYKSEQYLRPLQGTAVPHIIGVHVMPEAVSVTMEMPHSSFWIESSASMPHALKEKVIAAFEKIHAQGVLHGDPELRHMLIGADGNVMIIDFGMSRAAKEHPFLGIEKAEPEEFRLEMRKVKYKLDYMGARKKEGDKIEDYLRRVRRNRKISELWKRRAKGERVGPIPQYEEDPADYELDPPVNTQDFQEDWITASDDAPMRVVVPGQTSEEVASQVQTFIRNLEEMCSTPPQPSVSPCSSQARCQHALMTWIGDVEYVEDAFSSCSLPGCSRAKDENYDPQLYHAPSARRPKRRRPGKTSKHNSSPHGCEDDSFPLSARDIEDASRRRDYIRHKHLRNVYISSLSSNTSTATAFPSSIDVPENPRSLKPEEYRRIEESRRQAMAQYSRAPKGILKRGCASDGVDCGNQEDTQPACKRLRFTQQLALPSTRGRTAFPNLKNGRRSRVIVHSRSPKRLIAPAARPELLDFALPSFRTLSALVGSLIPWVHCRG